LLRPEIEESYAHSKTKLVDENGILNEEKSMYMPNKTTLHLISCAVLTFDHFWVMSF
jgi:hypothetical protein